MTTYSIVDESGETRLRGTIVPAPGGSQAGASVVKGPYPVDFSDIPNPDDSLTLLTPTAGLVVLRAWLNPRTYVPFEDEGSGSQAVFVGQASEFDADNDNVGWLWLDSDQMNDSVRQSSITSPALYPVALVPNVKLRMSVMHPLNEAVVAKYFDHGSGEDLTAGFADVYFEIATPDAP